MGTGLKHLFSISWKLEDAKMDPREVLILSKVKMEGDERGGIAWAEEVEMTIPSKGHPWTGADRWFKKKRPVRRVNDRKDTSYPDEVRLGIYLAMKQGKDVKEGERLEEEYIERLSRKPGVCKNSDMKNTYGSDLNPPKVNNFLDVEAMGEEALRDLINGWEDGPKINSRRVAGKMQHFVVLLNMSPRQVVTYFLKLFISRLRDDDTVSI